MRVLIIGGGGREHALGWKIAQSPQLTELFFAPGNAGTASLGESVSLSGLDEMVGFARDTGVDLVVVGPEQPLVDGLADKLRDAGVACFGPGAEAAQLEGSKAFAKRVMNETGAPTARHRLFTDYQSALAHIQERPHPLVVKADGLAGGKGVAICHRLEESREALELAMLRGKFGTAGARVVIEDFLEGVEASFHLISDGERFLPLIAAQDHKTLLDGNRGPNTGGMGAFAPNPALTPELARRIQTEICEPPLRWLAERGAPFRGVLFAGLMLTAEGPKTLEYNVRFGDPETQAIMPMLDFDLLPVLHGAALGRLPEGRFGWKDGAAVCVTLAAEGYPDNPRKGDPIHGRFETEDGIVFHAGSKRDAQNRLLVNGGRVLGVTAWADSLSSARAAAYGQVRDIQFPGMHYRKDIGGA